MTAINKFKQPTSTNHLSRSFQVFDGHFNSQNSQTKKGLENPRKASWPPCPAYDGTASKPLQTRIEIRRDPEYKHMPHPTLAATTGDTNRYTNPFLVPT
jgi:hypothetical protein